MEHVQLQAFVADLTQSVEQTDFQETHFAKAIAFTKTTKHIPATTLVQHLVPAQTLLMLNCKQLAQEIKHVLVEVAQTVVL